MDFLSLFGLIYSGTLMLYMSLTIASNVSDDAKERFWVCITLIALHLGTLSALTSLFTQLTPLGWLAMQSGISLAIFYFLPHATWRSLKARLESWRTSIIEWRYAFWSVISLRSLGTFWAICVIGVILLSGLQQFLTPISVFDDRMYHASRVAYWMQNQNVFPFVTHNDRQVVFSFGSELFLLWALLFTKTELIGRMMFWLGFPITALGLFSLMRELRLNRTWSTASVLAFLVTPIVLRLSLGLSPEIWLSVFVIGATYWVLRAAKHPSSANKYLFLAALNVMIALGVKFTALAVLPSVFALPFLIGVENKITAFKYIMSGTLLGLMASGLIIVLGFNEMNYGNPFGPASMRQVHNSDLSPIQIYTHTIRLPFFLLEFPVVPSAEVRDSLTNFGNAVISAVGADKPLPLETPRGWPGFYTYSVPLYGFRYSLGGSIWLPVLAIGLVRFIREMSKKSSGIRLSPLSLLFTLEVPLFAGIVYLIRWQSDSALPDRFLIAPYALAIAMLAILIDEIAHRQRFLMIVITLLVFSVAVVPVATNLHGILRSLSKPFPSEQIDEPFVSALSHIPPGSHILLVANQDTRDYALFNPREQYSNHVTPWGKLPFDSGRMQTLIENDHISHVLLQNDQRVDFHWEPSISTVEMTNWLTQQPYLTEIPLTISHLRLFARVQ